MSMTRIVEGRVLGTLVLVAGFAATAALPVSPLAAARRDEGRALDLVNVSVGGEHMPVLVAETNGIYAKYGISVAFPKLPPGGSDSVRASLANGTVDIVHSIVDNAVAVVELGGADVIIVMGGAGSLYELVAQPGIKSVADLRGKTMIVDAPNTALAVQMKKILMTNGLKPGVDCELKPLATGAQRLVEMRANRNYAAAMLGVPTSLSAKHEGFVGLGSSSKLLGPLQGASVYVRRQWASAHADLLERYMAATIEGERWLMAPANKAKVIELIASDGKVSREIAAEAYALEMGPGGWQKDMQFDVEAFKNLLKVRAEVEGTWGGKPPSPDKYYDPSYYRRALPRAAAGKPGKSGRY
jgi:ABC-type nitrate/sulfonate/bicarbonate transport system substrate-binding protein